MLLHCLVGAGQTSNRPEDVNIFRQHLQPLGRFWGTEQLVVDFLHLVVGAVVILLQHPFWISPLLPPLAFDSPDLQPNTLSTPKRVSVVTSQNVFPDKSQKETFL